MTRRRIAVEYRNLGRSGLLVSVVGLGCDNFGHRCDPKESAAIVHRAMDLGVTFFDTADIYGPGGLSEEYLGKALEGHRQDAVIATKFVGPTGSFTGLLHMGTSRRHILYAVEASLRRLGTDFIDLYQVHFPYPGVPMEETLRALDDLVHQGKVRYIGCSNFAAWQLVDANWIARTQHLTRFISAQNAYNLLDRQLEKELIPACIEHGVGILPYFPLASGFLSGKYRPGQTKPQGARLANERPTTEHLTGVPDAIVRQVNAELLRWVTPESIFTRGEFRPAGEAGGVRHRTWPHHPRPRHRLVGQPARRVERPRGRQPAGADRAERQRCRLAAHAGGAGRGQRDQRLLRCTCSRYRNSSEGRSP